MKKKCRERKKTLILVQHDFWNLYEHCSRHTMEHLRGFRPFVTFFSRISIEPAHQSVFRCWREIQNPTPTRICCPAPNKPRILRPKSWVISHFAWLIPRIGRDEQYETSRRDNERWRGERPTDNLGRVKNAPNSGHVTKQIYVLHDSDICPGLNVILCSLRFASEGNHFWNAKNVYGHFSISRPLSIC